ncbi:MAG: YggS family pyridoxal phosphate-dependent enzyme [candidate division Zixibacteria bacterium]|nr:YggS family pyridoxal phosphate-dependent enzyme [candidate division Zixibacteria bacterium]
METPEIVKDNLQRVREKINEAAIKSGRDSGSVTLLAVTKRIDSRRIVAAYQAGQRLFGENRVQEALGKLPGLKVLIPDSRWAMIGHLQSNKASKAVELFDEIHSVDSIKLAEEIGARALKNNLEIAVLIEVNSSGETAKFGVEIQKTVELVSQISGLAGIKVSGLMTMGPHTEDKSRIARSFALTRETIEKARKTLGLKLPVLSMGMSGDFEIAIAEGSNQVRLGTALFGERTPL